MHYQKFLWTAICAVAILSCDTQQKQETEVPVLTPTTTEDINVLKEGGQYNLTYYIDHPADDGRIEASVSPEGWIDGINTETPGIVSFNASANESEEIREASMKVTYIYTGGEPQSFSVRIVQEAADGSDDPDDPDNPDNPDDPDNPSDAPFTITVTDITYSTADITIVPDDLSMPFIVWVDEASEINGLDDDALFTEDLTIMESNAAMMGQSLQGYINLIVKHGEQNRKQGKLNPDTEYAVWCYGIDNSGSYPERTTDIARKTFTTDVPEVTDNGITLEVEVTGNTFSAVATPYTNDKYYNLNWNSESILQNSGFTDGTAAQRCFEFEYDYMSMYLAMGWSVTDLANVKQGPATTSSTFKKEDTYYVFAYFINVDDATADGDIYIKTIEYDGENATVLDAPGASFLRASNTDRKVERPMP